MGVISPETTIFTRMSALARKHQALNLGQGFPDEGPPDFLTEVVTRVIQSGFHQYAPMAGVPELREAISKKIFKNYGHRADPEKEVTVTAGGTQALFTAIAALVQPGDEVIIPEPAYDCYAPAVELVGGRCVFVPLNEKTFRPDWNIISSRLTEHTRMIIFNTPHNPSGAVWIEEDYAALSALASQHPFLVLSDEVYEHITFDGRKHIPLCTLPSLENRCLSVYSFGKVFHCTGWKMGYIVGGPRLTEKFRQVHQYNVFSVNTPLQSALAQAMENDTWFASLGPYFQRKRDLFISWMQGSKFHIQPAGGTYFQLLQYGEITHEDDLAFAERLTREKKLTLIPVSFFYHRREDHRLLRLCFAKSDDTLRTAAEILCSL